MEHDEIIDTLYGLPLSEFTDARNDAAKELRKAGERGAAEQVKGLRKPTAAAGAVNRLVREHRAGVEEFLRAAGAARDAQFSGKGDLGAANRQQHAALDTLVGLGGEDVRQSLLAAAVDDEAARQVLEGRLVHELEPAGFGTLLEHVTPGGKRLKPAPKTRPRPAPAPAPSPGPPPAPRATEEPPLSRTQHELRPKRQPEREKSATNRERTDEPARTRLADAEAALRAAEAEEQQARRHWDDTRREVDKAREAVERALRDLDPGD